MAEISDEQVQRIAAAAVHQALQQTTRLSRDDASDLITATATKAVNEAHVRLFSHLGYDLANKEDISRLRATMDFAERLRLRSESIGQSVSNAVANAVALGLIGLLLLGFIVWSRGAGSPSGPPSAITK